MSSIPLVDLTSEIDLLWVELNAAIQEVLRSGEFIRGNKVKDFENAIQDYLGVKHAISLNSGTDALIIGLNALGVGPGDEVIVPSFTFFASVEPISMMGATPVFVDIEPTTFNLDVEEVKSKITPRTRAIIPVHLFGQAANMQTLILLAEQYDLKILEDTAQAFGGTLGGRLLGTFGHMGAFSFFPTKNLGAYGDGGLLTTNDDKLAEISRMLSSHGSKEKYHNERFGYNSRLDTLQAAILLVKLPQVEQWNEARRVAAQNYRSLLATVEGIVLPIEEQNSRHVYHQYTIRVLRNRRDRVRAYLAERGIMTAIYYPVPIHQLPVYQHMNVSLPQTELAAREVLSLPMWAQITPEQQQRVATTLKEALEQC